MCRIIWTPDSGKIQVWSFHFSWKIFSWAPLSCWTECLSSASSAFAALWQLLFCAWTLAPFLPRHKPRKHGWASLELLLCLSGTALCAWVSAVLSWKLSFVKKQKHVHCSDKTKRKRTSLTYISPYGVMLEPPHSRCCSAGFLLLCPQLPPLPLLSPQPLKEERE